MLQLHTARLVLPALRRPPKYFAFLQLLSAPATTPCTNCRLLKTLGSPPAGLATSSTADYPQERTSEDPFVSAERKLSGTRSLAQGRKPIKGFTSIHIDQEEFEKQYTDVDTKQLFGKRQRPEKETDKNDEPRSPFPQSKEWTETFGTLADEDDKPERVEDGDEIPEDQEEERPYVRLDTYRRRHNPAYYSKKIVQFARQGKLFEAVDVLETEMLKEDRVMPTTHNFSVLIKALGKVGYTRKAFSLFNRMKKMGLEPPDHIYTSLFNACSNSPEATDGIHRADNLRRLMVEKNLLISHITYKAMIKAYAKQGSLQQAFSVVDEIVAAGHALDTEDFSFLLMACISDKEAGLKHGIEVWRRMRKRKIRPNIFHYNMLLRAVRECSLGDAELAHQLLKKGLHVETEASELDPTATPQMLDLASAGIDDTRLVPNQQQRDSDSDSIIPTPHEADYSSSSVLEMQVPNILNPRGKFNQVLALQDLNSPIKRLGLLGGMAGLLSHMERDEVVPTIKTATLFLDVIPSNRDAEADLLSVMTVHNIKPDVGFFNMLIRKRNKRLDIHGAKEVLPVMAQHQLTPNIHTFGCLAMGCTRRRDGVQLLADMEAAGLVPNVEICTILNLGSKLDFKYKFYICQAMHRLNVLPNENFLRILESKLNAAKKIIVQQEKGHVYDNSYFNSEEFKASYLKFVKFYHSWIRQMDLDEEEHPWARFDRPSIETLEQRRAGQEQEQEGVSVAADPSSGR